MHVTPPCCPFFGQFLWLPEKGSHIVFTWPFLHFLTLLTVVAAELLFQFKSDVEFKRVSHVCLPQGWATSLFDGPYGERRSPFPAGLLDGSSSISLTTTIVRAALIGKTKKSPHVLRCTVPSKLRGCAAAQLAENPCAVLSFCRAQHKY